MQQLLLFTKPLLNDQTQISSSNKLNLLFLEEKD